MWYVVWTTAGNEHRLRARIMKETDPGLYGEIWVPVRREMRKAKGERKEVERPIFPGYLFASPQDPVKLHVAIRGCRGYLGILKSGGRFMPLSPEDEGFIKKIGSDKAPAEVSTGFIRGGRLHVVEGPLKGLEEYIVKIDRHKMRAILEMDLFGKLRRFALGLCVVNRE